jgi:hypothetical protein
VSSPLERLRDAVGARRRPVVLMFVDLVQDIDVLLPVMLSMRDQGRLATKIRVSRWLAEESPRTAALLDRHGLGFSYVRRREVIAGRAPSLTGVSAVMAASESSHPAHAAAHALALRAAGAGLATYAVQHGLENVGLFGLGAEEAGFASGAVFCWFPRDATPRDLPASTRSKLDHVGRPEPPGGWRRADGARFDLGVFENLHWDRYSDDDRDRFRAGLTAVARALPDLSILLRPHPAGGWADRLRHELAQFGNITASPASDARRGIEGAVEIMQGVKRVITTPSTVALDAALAGRPVALAAAGGAVYEPLPRLDGPDDWVAFAGSPALDSRTLDQFRSRVLVAGDGAPRIVERVSRDLANEPPITHG